MEGYNYYSGDCAGSLGRDAASWSVCGFRVDWKQDLTYAT